MATGRAPLGARRALTGWAGAVLLAAIVLAVGAALYLEDPARGGIFPPCLLHALTGLHCPGCGSLRALYSLLHGRVGDALGFNPLAVLVLPFLGYALASRLVGRPAGGPLPGVEVRPRWAWALVAAVLLFGLLRNLPVWPFSVLAP